MPHSYNRVWIHAVFSTKGREPMITEATEKEIFEWMRQELIDIGCPPKIINGMPDHVHMLFRLSPKIAVMEVLKQVKGNTSNWINERGLLNSPFNWQTGYGAFSVSESKVDTVYHYIQRQKEHHKTQNYEDEFAWLVRHHGMIY